MHEDEAEALKAMFQATEEHWKETGEKMSTLVLCSSYVFLGMSDLFALHKLNLLVFAKLTPLVFRVP